MRVSILRRQKTQAEKTVIKPIRGWIPIDLGAIWSHRELLYFLVWRELKVRYKQTVLGVGWAVVQPFLMAVDHIWALRNISFSVKKGGGGHRFSSGANRAG